MKAIKIADVRSGTGYVSIRAYLTHLFAYEWVKTKSPAGATQWIPKDDAAATLVPDAHDKDKRHAPIMLTTDIALKTDPDYEKIDG